MTNHTETIDRDTAFTALCMMEELANNWEAYCYRWARDIQADAGDTALRYRLLDIAAYADDIYMEIYDNSADKWDFIAFDCEYIPEFMAAAMDEHGRVLPDALEIMNRWRKEYQRRAKKSS